jgi:RNA polymerase sigma-70 factor, ECF subfamily
MHLTPSYTGWFSDVTYSTLPMPAQQPKDDTAALSQQSDAEVFLALQSGQLEALGILYDRHAALVYGAALYSLKRPQEAEDLTQDIFLSLAKGSSYHPSRGTLRTFLTVLTRSRAIDRLRSRSKLRQHTHSNLIDTATPNFPAEHIVQVERSHEVQTALSQLPESEQQVLKLAYYEGLSQSEIASQLELSLGTVKSRARRGLIKLRQMLEDFVGKS